MKYSVRDNGDTTVYLDKFLMTEKSEENEDGDLWRKEHVGRLQNATTRTVFSNAWLRDVPTLLQAKNHIFFFRSYKTVAEKLDWNDKDGYD